MERLEFDLLFRWFVGLGIDDAVWHPTVFTHNRDRVLTTEVAQGFLSALLAQPAVKKLLSAEHFSVDGTMLKAFASMKSFRAKDGAGRDDGEPPEGGRNGERDFRKEKRSNETHASTTDPDARLYRKSKGQESRLAYLGHGLELLVAILRHGERIGRRNPVRIERLKAGDFGLQAHLVAAAGKITKSAFVDGRLRWCGHLLRSRRRGNDRGRDRRRLSSRLRCRRLRCCGLLCCGTRLGRVRC